jgi:hypothetical protein
MTMFGLFKRFLRSANVRTIIVDDYGFLFGGESVYVEGEGIFMEGSRILMNGRVRVFFASVSLSVAVCGTATTLCL